MGRARVLIASVVLIALAIVVGVVLHQRHVRPTVSKVLTAASRPVTTRALPEDLPDFSERGWYVVGGRSDEIGGRTVVTARYRRGRDTVTYSRMADEKGLHDDHGATVRTSGGVEMSWENTPGLAARTLNGEHQVVMSGSPASQSLRREMTLLAALIP
jgi:hypothetical protein